MSHALNGHAARAASLPPTGYLFFAACLCLTLFGIVALSSAGRAFSSDPHFILKRQTLWLAAALPACAFGYFVPLCLLRKWSPLIALGGLGILALVMVPGVGLNINGAQRWIDLGFMRMQPSEFAKPALVIALAACLAACQRHLKTFWRGFVLPSTLIGLFCGLIIIEPDFGTALLFGAMGFTVMFIVGVRLWYLLPTVIGGMAAFATLVYYDPVRLARITSFLDVEGNKQDSAYQLWQALLAFGVGGTDGVGLGNGRQQLSFLPEAHTDFVCAIIGEEFGLVATLAIVLVFFFLFILVVWNLRKAPDLFGFVIALGAALFICFQAIINLGVVTGLLPTKGMSLPFISYGGSNLVVMFLFAGLILNCFRAWEAPPLPGPSEL